MLISRDAGDVSNGPLPADTARTSILIAMLTISIYMSALVDLKVLTLFKRRNTLYFWSLLITSWGIWIHSLGVLLKWFVGSCPWGVYTAFSSFGWWGMVTGQSLVLYSRLHLVVRDERLLRAILIMIIVDFCLFQFPTTLQKFLSGRTNAGVWLTVYHVYERIQLIVFTLQELVISGIYIRAAVNWLSPSDPEGMRSTKYFLIYLNVLCIALDVIIVCEVSTDQWVYEEATQSLVYAIKLTLEFAVLNQVMEMYRLGPGGCTTCHRRFASIRVPDGSIEEGADHRNTRDHEHIKKANSSTSRWLRTPWPMSKPEVPASVKTSDKEPARKDSLVIDVVTEIKTVSIPR